MGTSTVSRWVREEGFASPPSVKNLAWDVGIEFRVRRIASRLFGSTATRLSEISTY